MTNELMHEAHEACQGREGVQSKTTKQYSQTIRRSTKRSLRLTSRITMRKRIKILLSAVVLTPIISLNGANSAPVDIAPISDQVIKNLIQERFSRKPDALSETLRHHLKETERLIDSLEAAENNASTNAAKGKEKSILNNKRNLVDSKINELRSLRAEISAQISKRKTQLTDPNEAKNWDKFLTQVDKRFQDLTDALTEARGGRAKAIRKKAAGKARALLRRYQRGKEDKAAKPSLAAQKRFPNQLKPFTRPDHTLPGYVPPITEPVPTFHQDVPVLEQDNSDIAPPPQYMSSPRVPSNIYASLGEIVLAAAPPTPTEASSCSYTSADLAENTDVKLTAEIRDLAKKLQYSPARIFDYVSNNIEFEPYFGSLKGAVGTLVSGAGNATDQASLTIALLRASNIPSRYVKGRVRFSNGDKRLLNWLGVKTSKAAARTLAAGLVPTSGTSTVTFTHVWVEACVPYGNYRGSAFDNSGHRWIPLDPSFKNKSYQDGIGIDLDFDYNGYLSTRTFDMPDEHFENQVLAHIKSLPPRYSNNTLEDVGFVGKVVPQKVDILPASLPYPVYSYLAWDTGLTAETATLPANHRYTFKIDVGETGEKGSVSLKMPEMALKRVTLSFTPGSGSATTLNNAYQAQVNELNSKYGAGAANYVLNNGGIQCKWDYRPVIKVDGTSQSVGGSVSPVCYYWLDEWYGGPPSTEMVFPKNTLKMAVLLGEGTSAEKEANKVTFPGKISVFEYHALQAYAFQGSDRLLTERADKLLTNVNNISNPASNKEETLGEFLHLVGLKYMRYVTDAGESIGQLYGETGYSGNHLGLTSSRSSVSYLFDLPYAVRDVGFLVDVPGGRSRSANIETGGSSWRSFLLWGYTASAYESYVWQENARMDAVSSVRGIQFARDKNIEVLTITKANSATQIPKLRSNANADLNYSESTENTIKSLVNGGATVTMPRSLIEYGNWKGQVYISAKGSDNTSKSALFAIGQFAGGYTVSPPAYTWATPTQDIPTGWQIPLAFQDTGSTAAVPVINSGNNFGRTEYVTTAGDPVNMVTGNMYHTEQDISIKGRGLPIVFERTYNSMMASRSTATSVPLGYGWTHSFNQYLKFNDDDFDSTQESVDSDSRTSSVTWVDGSGGQKYIRVAGSTSGVAVGSNFTTPEGFYFQVNRISGGKYTIREKNGLTYTFESVAGTVNQKARLLTVQDRNGNTLTLSYSGNRLNRVTDGLGRYLQFGYAGNDRIDSITDWAGRRHEYKYDGAGNLQSYHNPLAVAGDIPPVTYQYYTSADGDNLNHAMHSYNLPRGNGMTFEYYMNGKVFRHYNTLGESMTFTYNDFRREATTVNERGLTHKYFFDENGNPTKTVQEGGGIETYAYDAVKPMNRLSKTDPMGYVTQYQYDASGNVTKVINPSGSTVEYSYFNSFHQPGKLKDANGNYTLYKYDAKGNRTSVIRLKKGYGASVNPNTYTPVPSQLLSWTISTYDSYGNPLTIKQVRDFNTQVGPTTEFGYNDTVNNVAGLNAVSVTRCGDRNGDGTIDRPTECDVDAQTYDGLGRMTDGIRGDFYPIHQEYDAVNRITRATDNSGNLRDFDYDENGNPTSSKLMVDRSGTQALVDQSATTYDLSDRADTKIDAGGFVTAYQYDEVGNVIKITNPDGYSLGMEYDPNNQLVRAYDEEGNTVSRELDINGRPRVITDPNGNSITFEYYGPEKEGRLKQRCNALIRCTTFDYDNNGNVIEVTDNLGRTTVTEYDALNRPVRIVGSLYTDAVLGNVRPVTKYRYNNLSNLTEVSAGHTDSTGTNPASDVVTVQETSTFDDLGRKLTKSDPLGKTWQYEYDKHGNVTKVTDPKGQILVRTHLYGSRIENQYAYRYDGDPSPHTIRYSYNALGLKTKIESPEVTYLYYYDAAHRLTAVTDSRGGKRIEYAYSPGGMLNSMRDTEGNETQYLYDPVGRLTGIWAPNGDLVTFIRDSGGRLLEKWFPNGVNTRYRYNADNTLEQVVNRAFSGDVISQHDYTYDGIGNRETHRELIGGVTKDYRYTYDPLNRLTEVRNNADNSLIESYSYDPLNNRKTLTAGGNTLAYVYDNANQLVETRQGTEAGPLLAGFVYNDNGALTKRCEGGSVSRSAIDCSGDSSLTLSYDALHRLVQADKTGNAVESYQYDPLGRRIEKNVGATMSRYRYAGPDIVAEYGDDWSQANSLYVHGPQWDDPLIRTQADSASEYYHQDGLGSVVAASDKTGVVAGTARYDAWGKTIASSGNISQYGYTGREPDDTGLIYYRARYYDPNTGRFNRRDPKGFIDGINRYAYAINNPVNYKDPRGTSVFDNASTNTTTANTSYCSTCGTSSITSTSSISSSNQNLASSSSTTSTLLVNPTGGGIRSDGGGDGSFGASRGTRTHAGIDLQTTNGQNVVSPITGTATNFVGATSGYPMVDITPSDTSQIQMIRMLYIDAPAGATAGGSYPVTAGQSIGTAANLQNLGYPDSVTPHVHIQIKKDGEWTDPTPYFFEQ